MDELQRAQETWPRTGTVGDTVGVDAMAQLSLGGADPEEALARLTTALRAGLPGSRLGAGPMSLQMPVGTHPFEYFSSPDGPAPIDATVQRTQDLPRESMSAAADSGAAAIVDRRVALMTQDMAAFGGVGHEASLRLNGPTEGLRLDYFA